MSKTTLNVELGLTVMRLFLKLNPTATIKDYAKYLKGGNK